MKDGETEIHATAFDLTAEKFELAKTRLGEEFGEPRLAIKRHLEALDKLTGSGKDIKVEKLNAFVNNDVSQHVLALLSLGKTYDSLTTLAEPKILKCVPEEMRFPPRHRMKFAVQMQQLVVFNSK